jgi:putative FmdB family regulatory protein
MPLYEYRCGEGHTAERLRKFDARDDATRCERCGSAMSRVFSAHHAPVDGIYSYAPNLGDPTAFERKLAKSRGEIPRDAS